MLDLQHSGNKRVTMYYNFLEMVGDFLSSVDSYQVGDAISVEQCDSKHFPVWLLLGQTEDAKINYNQ